MGTLFIVATPIGNLNDFSKRAIETLKESDLILVEDTRQTIKLLNHFDIKTKMVSYHKFNEKERTKEIIDALKDGQNGELWVYESKACTIKELADAFSDNQIVTGTESIEKNDEALVTTNELNHSKKYKDYFVIRKDYTSDTNYTEPLTSYTAQRLTQDEIKEMIDSWRESCKS